MSSPANPKASGASRLWALHVHNSHLDATKRRRFNQTVLYALVSSESDYAVESFATRETADETLREILQDEPDFAPLLRVIGLVRPWDGVLETAAIEADLKSKAP